MNPITKAALGLTQEQVEALEPISRQLVEQIRLQDQQTRKTLESLARITRREFGDSVGNFIDLWAKEQHYRRHM